MGIVINNNPTALNAWRNLSASNTKLGKSLQKLSSGLQINKGSDNPAGLVISEKLRAQATGLEQAVKNAGDAVSVIQVAEGALQEVHSILNSIRALAVHASNEGANDASSIAADQSQVDNAIDAISRIANTTKYLGKYLLNGGAGNTSTVDGVNVSAITLSTVDTTGDLEYNVTQQATVAKWTSNSNDWSANHTMSAIDDTLTINNVGFDINAATNRTTFLSTVNTRSAETGVHASVNGNNIAFEAAGYGNDYAIKLDWSASSNVLGAATHISGGLYTIGLNVEGTINAEAATGSGLTLTADTSTAWAGTAVTFMTTTGTGVDTDDITVTKSQLKFNIGANAVANEIVSFQINDMRATALGTAGNGYLDDATGTGIKTGQGNALATNAAGAVTIIDDAIADVSSERSKLGAYQKNAIETMQNNLGATLENIQAAESRIRDLDMAKEMMTFTKNQILIQAGTSMLAQANQIPQSALQLIG